MLWLASNKSTDHFPSKAFIDQMLKTIDLKKLCEIFYKNAIKDHVGEMDQNQFKKKSKFAYK